MKEKLIEKLISLLGVRTIVTLALVGALIYGFIVGKIPTEQFVPLVLLAAQSLFVKKANEENNMTAQEQVEEKIKVQEPNDLGGVG